MFPFLRPILRGNLIRPWLLYRLSLELGREDPFVLDAHFDIEPSEAFGVRVGQQGTPVSRHESFGSQQIFFPEFASVATYFWSGRERGVTLYGTVLEERLDYYAGIYGGSPIDEPADLEDNFVVEARLTANPMGPVNANELPFTEEGGPLPLRFSVTAQGFYGRLQTVDESYNLSNSVLMPNALLSTSKLGLVGGDVWFQSGRAIVFGEFYWRRQRLIGSANWYGALGAWGQIIVNVYRNVIGADVRLNWIDPTPISRTTTHSKWKGSSPWFVKPPQLTVKLRYAWLKQRSPDPDELDDFELPYVEGTTHVATLQGIMAF